MKNVVSIVVFAVVFLGLGAMALMAAPGGTDLVAEFNPSETAGSAPQEVAVTNKFNLIALPLDSSASITPFKASGLAAYHGSSVKQVSYWNNGLQAFSTYVPGVSPPFLDFDLIVGGGYMLLVDSTSPDVISFVGDVPGIDDVSHTITPSVTACAFDLITIPLDRSDITKASNLAADVTALSGVDSVTQVMYWNTTLQGFSSFVPGVSPPVLDFDIKIGYPYMICTNGTAAADWQ